MALLHPLPLLVVLLHLLLLLLVLRLLLLLLVLLLLWATPRALPRRPLALVVDRSI
jgi:hypothetical protein